jgi:hypothetical protein
MPLPLGEVGATRRVRETRGLDRVLGLQFSVPIRLTSGTRNTYRTTTRIALFNRAIATLNEFFENYEK